MPSLKGTLKTTGVIWSPNANIRVTILRTSQALLQDVTSLLLVLPSIDCWCYCCPSIAAAAAACSTPPLLISILASLFFPTTIWSSCLNTSMEPFESFVGIVLGAKLCQIKLGFDSSFFFFEDHSDEGLNWILQEINSTVSKTADVGCSTRG